VRPSISKVGIDSARFKMQPSPYCLIAQQSRSRCLGRGTARFQMSPHVGAGEGPSESDSPPELEPDSEQAESLLEFRLPVPVTVQGPPPAGRDH
jgi:hypothetical protein